VKNGGHLQTHPQTQKSQAGTDQARTNRTAPLPPRLARRTSPASPARHAKLSDACRTRCIWSPTCRSRLLRHLPRVGPVYPTLSDTDEARTSSREAVCPSSVHKRSWAVSSYLGSPSSSRLSMKRPVRPHQTILLRSPIFDINVPGSGYHFLIEDLNLLRACVSFHDSVFTPINTRDSSCPQNLLDEDFCAAMQFSCHHLSSKKDGGS
jgi:hypothetical protein